MLRVVLIPAIEPLEHNEACLASIKKCLKKGISVCIFVESPLVQEEIERLKKSKDFQEIIKDTGVPIVPVEIDKKDKTSRSRYFIRFLNKIRVPAFISFG